MIPNWLEIDQKQSRCYTKTVAVNAFARCVNQKNHELLFDSSGGLNVCFHISFDFDALSYYFACFAYGKK